MKIEITSENELNRLFTHCSMEAVRSVLAYLNRNDIALRYTTKESMLEAFISSEDFKPFTILTDEFYCNGISEYVAPTPVIIEIEKPRKQYNWMQELIIKLFILNI